MHDVETLMLPRSRLELQWRAVDSTWRAVAADKPERPEEPWADWRPGEDSFVRSHLDSDRAGKAETWWVLYGEAPQEDGVTVVLADGARPDVVTIGRLWACEWVGPAQDAVVRFAGGPELAFSLSRWAGSSFR